MKQTAKYLAMIAAALAVLLGLLLSGLHSVVCYDLYQLQDRIELLADELEAYHRQHQAYPAEDEINSRYPTGVLPTDLHYSVTKSSYRIAGSDGWENWLTYSPEEGWFATRSCLGLLK